MLGWSSLIDLKFISPWYQRVVFPSYKYLVEVLPVCGLVSIKELQCGSGCIFSCFISLHGGISVIQPFVRMEYLSEGFDCSVNYLTFVTVVQKCWRLQGKRVITDAMKNSNDKSWKERHPGESLRNNLGSLAQGRLGSVDFREDIGLLKNLDWEDSVRMCNQTPWTYVRLLAQTLKSEIADKHLSDRWCDNSQ